VDNSLSKLHDKVILVAMRDHLTNSYSSVPPRSTMDNEQRMFFAHVGRVIREKRREIAESLRMPADSIFEIGAEVEQFYAVRRTLR
jgi:hypothetical protein